MSDSNDGADPKGRTTAAQGTRSTQRDVKTSPSNAGQETSNAGSGGTETTEGSVQTREAQYLIAPRVLPGGFTPMSSDVIHAALNDLPGVTIVRRIKPLANIDTLSANTPTVTHETIVARMTPERGLELETAARQGASVIVERDQLLNHHGLAPAEQQPATGTLPSIFSRNPLQIQFRIVNAQGQPMRGAQVTVYGRNFPGQGETDQNGTTTVTLPGETQDSIRALYVKPPADHWERFVDRPNLDMQGVNTVALQPLSAMFSEFPNKQMTGWGQILMGLDKIPMELDGANVKIGIIDSGCDNTHPLLQHVRNGVDVTNPDDPNSWTHDEIFHGTHCAGVIAGGRAAQAQGIRGFAPGAEVHVFKVFPGGRFSNLIDALDLCIARGIDVVNCSLGSDQISEIVQNKLEEARQKGVACVVAAGNSSGPVQFPATLPSVLSVSAIGQDKRFPADTYHAQTMVPGTVGVNGIFPAKFSCFGPQVKVCGPGVAIVSAVPGGGYAAWDGTSMAAPHLTGMAALVLAHHPAFQSALKARTAQRVDTLFQMIVSSATAVYPDHTRVGAGLPDVTRLVSSQQPVSAATQAATIAQLAPTLGPAFGALAGVPLGPQIGALLGQLLTGGGAGSPPFMVGSDISSAINALQASQVLASYPPYLQPTVLMHLRSLGLA